MSQDFKSMTWEAITNVPAYGRWLRETDQRSAYEYHRNGAADPPERRGARPLDAEEPAPRDRARRVDRGVPGRAARPPAPRPGRALRVGLQPDQHAVRHVHATRTTLRTSPSTGPRPSRSRSGASTRSAPRTRSTRSSTCSTRISCATRSRPCGRSHRACGDDRSATRPRPRSRPTSTRTPRARSGHTATTCTEFGLDPAELTERFSGYIERYDVPAEHQPA